MKKPQFLKAPRLVLFHHIFLIVTLLGIRTAFAANHLIDDGQILNLSDVAHGDSVEFSGSSGSPFEGVLNVDSDGVLGVAPLTFESNAISGSYDRGEVDFVMVNKLTVLGNLYLRSVNFSADGVLSFEGSSFSSEKDAITTTTDGTGSVLFNTADFFNYVQGDFGTQSHKLKLIEVTDSKYPAFGDSIYADKFVLNNSNVAFSFEKDSYQETYEIGEIMIGAGSELHSGTPHFINFNSSGSGLFMIHTGLRSTETSISSGIIDFSGTSRIASNLGYYIYNDDTEYYSVSDNPLAGYIDLAESSSLTVSDNITLLVTATDISNAITPETDFKLIDYSSEGAVLNIDISSINVTSEIADTYFNLLDDGSFIYLRSTDVPPANSRVSLLKGEAYGFSEVINKQTAAQGEMAELRTQLLGISEIGELKRFAKTLSPSKQSAQVVVSQVGNKVSKMIDSRTAALNSSQGFSSGDNAATHGVWGEFFGGSASQGSLSEQDAYDLKMMGMMFGFDKKFDITSNVNTTIGTSFTYAESKIDMLGAGDKGVDVNSYQVSIYNHNAALDGLGFYNDNSVNAGVNHYKTQRTIESIGVASGNFKGQQYGAQTGIGYTLKLSDHVMISPNASINFYRVFQDNYQETGTGNVGLKVEAKPFDIFLASLGVKIEGKVAAFGINLLPEFSVDWIRNLKKEGQETSATFIAGGNSVTSFSNSLLKDVVNVGGNIVVIQGESSSISLGYDLHLGHEFSSHTGHLNYRWEF